RLGQGAHRLEGRQRVLVASEGGQRPPVLQRHLGRAVDRQRPPQLGERARQVPLGAQRLGQRQQRTRRARVVLYGGLGQRARDVLLSQLQRQAGGGHLRRRRGPARLHLFLIGG